MTDPNNNSNSGGGAPAGMPKLQASHEGEHHGDFGREIKLTRATYIFVLCAALNSCNLGYDIGASTAAGKLVQEDMDLTRIQRELFVGSLNLWAMFGALFAQYFSDQYGRRRTFIMAAVGFITGCVIMSISPGYGLLMVGRFFVGIGVGIGLAIDPMYIAEVSPAKHRGHLVTWAEIALNIGIVLGFTMSLFLAPLGDGAEWRIMFLCGAILPVVMIFLVTNVMPESPRWLVQNNQVDEARVILQQIYPEGFDVAPVIEDIQEALERERAAEKAVGWDVIFSPTKAIQRMLLVGVGTAVAQQAVGIDAIQYYLLDLLEESGIKTKTGETLTLIFLGILKLIFIVVGGFLFDNKGRRPLFFVSLAGMTVALLMVSIAFFVDSNASTGFVVFGLAIYLSFFSVGMGPGAWLIPSEVFASCVRAKAMSVATFSNRLTATLMASTFLSTANAIGWSGFFLLLSCICVIVFCFLYIYLPETKGRSLEDMSIYFAELTGDTSVLEAEANIRKHNPSVEMPKISVSSENGGSTGEVL